jgi:hypothetical protein
MPRRDGTLIDKIVLLEQIINQLPNSSKRNCEMNGHYATDNRELPKNGSMKVRIQMFKRPSISGSVL